MRIVTHSLNTYSQSRTDACVLFFVPIAIQHSVRCFFVSPPYVRRGIHEKRGRQYQSSGYQSFWLLVPCGLARLSPFGPPGTLKTGGTQSFCPPRYPEDWRDSVLWAPRYPVDGRDSVLVSFSPPGTLWIGWTQSFQAPGTLWTCGTQYVLPPRYSGDRRDSVLLAPRGPVDWWDSVISAPQVPLGLNPRK